MTGTFPITPPPELVQQWNQEAVGTHFKPFGYAEFIAAQAAQWGSDRELEACCEWLVRNYNYPEAGNPLRAARRPKPPSLKEQALAALEVIPKLVGFENERDAIRRALETLDD